jgi:hypothetical protein
MLKEMNSNPEFLTWQKYLSLKKSTQNKEAYRQKFLVNHQQTMTQEILQKELKSGKNKVKQMNAM